MQCVYLGNFWAPFYFIHKDACNDSYAECYLRATVSDDSCKHNEAHPSIVTVRQEISKLSSHPFIYWPQLGSSPSMSMVIAEVYSAPAALTVATHDCLVTAYLLFGAIVEDAQCQNSGEFVHSVRGQILTMIGP